MEEYTETAKSYDWQDMYWYSLAWCGGERCLAGLKIPDIAPSRDTTMVGDTGQIGSLASGQKPCQCLNRGPPRKNPNTKLQFYCIVVLLFEYVVVMVLKFGGVPMSGDLQNTWWDLWQWIKLVDRMEGVDEYHLEAVVFGGLEVAWWEDLVQLDGSSFRWCMKRKSEINNTIETIILKPWDLGDSWNWLFFVNSIYSNQLLSKQKLGHLHLREASPPAGTTR